MPMDGIALLPRHRRLRALWRSAGRYFLKRGVPGFILDGRISGMPSHYVSGKEPRFYKGPQAPQLNDLAFTEKVIFG